MSVPWASRAGGCVFAFLSLISLVGRASAIEYTFTTIADTDGPFASLRRPAINNNGTVTFLATLDNGGEGIFAGSGGAIATVADDSGQFSAFDFEEPSINPAGEVAFGATLDSGASGVFRLGGGTVTAIADTSGSFTSFCGVSLNDDGTVAFFGAGEDSQGSYQGIYTGAGGPITTVAEAHATGPTEVLPLSDPPSINNEGMVAFFARVAPGEGAICTGNGGPVTTIVDTSGVFSDFAGWARSPINDSGTIAFTARLDTGTVGVFSISDDTVTTVADSDGAFVHRVPPDGFYDVMLNDGNEVAFGGTLKTGESGIFTGGDPTLDKVIMSGDDLDGSTLGRPFFWGQGLNDHGQIAFVGYLKDGRAGVYVATPIPEPSTFVLLGTGAVGLLVCCSRRKRATQT